MSDARTTTDHDDIRRRAKARGGHPAAVKTSRFFKFVRREEG